jgi:ribonucleotide reductase beta subunit family protein with ferritin-like domain
MYEKQRKQFWWDTEVVFIPDDERDWKKLTDKERYFMENILAFFATADGIVMENLAMNFLREIQLPEARAFFTIQLMIEHIHSLVYAKLLDGYVKDPERKKVLLAGNHEIPAVKAKTDWALKWTTGDADLAERLVAFACVEGLHFQGEFCAIEWMREQGKLPALTFSNNLIRLDEGLHFETICLLYRDYMKDEKLADERVHLIVKEAFEIESSFINDVLDCALIGMNKELMTEYVKHVTSIVCTWLGHPPLFKNTKNPFDFMDRICFNVKENFFESRVSNYQRPPSHDNCVIKDGDFSADF